MAFIGFTACNQSAVSKQASNNSKFPALLERTDTTGKQGEWLAIQDMYTKYTTTLTQNPADDLTRIKLSEVYMNEARITGQQTYYYNAALTLLNEVIDNKAAKADNRYFALAYKASVLLSLHQFAEAKKVADEAHKTNSFDSGIYGALVDANVELGNYDTAVAYCDKMLSMRPDLRSYSRASYLRQIYGDNQGAIDAMKMAVAAGPEGIESTEWARVVLGDLYLNMGKLDTARMIYQASLSYRQGYPYATIGLAKVARAEKKYDEAIEHTKNAIRTLSEASFVGYMGELYELKGDKDKAKEVADDVVDLLQEAQKEETEETLSKHNANRELATAYMNAGDLDKALEFAKNDLQMRPENIDANELAAWIYYLKKDYPNAKMHTDKMMRTNAKNSNSMYKAGLIYTAAGDAAKGTQLKQDALKLNPHIDAKILNASAALAQR